MRTVRAERFEDLIAWQKARSLTKEIYLATREGQFAQDFRLAGQMQSAAVSTMSNIAEGFERGGPGEFHQFLCIARGSNAEVRSQLYVALDVGYIEESEFHRLYAQADEVGRIVGGLRSSVSRARKGVM